MFNMWWKLLLLTLYLGVLFLLSRLLEAVSWYDAGYLASRLLDPVSLSVKKLKMLLDQRGISYAGVVEKQELNELMETSGDVTEGELEAAALAEAEEGTSTNFTCGAHFYEEVEDTKDSVWVVQVKPHRSFMHDEAWMHIVKHLARFGVRTGVFDCSLDRMLCERRGWRKPCLVLALPHGYRAKDDVVLRDYTGAPRARPVLNWVNSHLASRIQRLHSAKELEQWSNFSSASSQNVRLLLFSSMPDPPMMLSVLSVKFTGRVQFGMLDPSVLDSPIATLSPPSYLVLTPEQKYLFGQRSGEHLTLQSLSLFLRTLHPEVNDVFLLSLLLVNAACWLELALVPGSVLPRFGHLLWAVGKWNFMLIVLCLPLLALLPYIEPVIAMALMALRTTSLSTVACWLRSDWLRYTLHLHLTAVTFAMYAVLLSIVHHIYHPSSPPSPPWSSVLRWPTLTSSTSSSNDIDMELLIARLAVPHFWLRPVICAADYISRLPVWLYTLPPDSDTDDPKEALQFICEKCRNVTASTPAKAVDEEEERLAEESACAKLLMDGDYRCACQQAPPIVQAAPACEEKAPAGMLLLTDCAICLDSYQTGAVLCGLPCAHSFHQQCIMAWLTRDNHCCPVCRWPAYKTKPCSLHSE